jgi:hypothetical protein
MPPQAHYDPVYMIIWEPCSLPGIVPYHGPAMLVESEHLMWQERFGPAYQSLVEREPEMVPREPAPEWFCELVDARINIEIYRSPTSPIWEDPMRRISYWPSRRRDYH